MKQAKQKISKLGKEKAERVIKFIETYCTHTKGKWAGQPFLLLPWQKDIIYKLFGTLRPDGRRQYRFCYLEIPKKNGKTELAAALALYLLCYDNEQGGEVYSAAADREQAGQCYEVAAQMVRNNKSLQARLGVIDSRKRIVDYKTNSFYHVLSAESYTKHGINPSGILFDELHAQPTDELWRVLTSGTDYAREQQLIFVTTTAGIYDKTSIWWRIRTRAIQIAKGVIADSTFLPVLYIADKDEDDPEDEKLWKRVNPSIDQIFTLEKIREDFAIARQDPVDYNDFLRFRLNIPVSALSAWINPKDWEACGGVVDPAVLIGKRCYAGLDLADESDIAAYVLVFPPQDQLDKYAVLCRFFVPEINMQERIRKDKVNYDIWAQQGHLTATPGNVIDYRFILDQISKDAELYDLKEIAFDRWGASKMVQDLQEMGFEDEDAKHTTRHLIKFGQGFASMARPTKELRKLARGGELRHGNNPVLNWMSHNMLLEPDAAGNYKPNKAKSSEKIDGMVALIMAIDRATMDTVQNSVYEERGIIAL